MRIDKDIKQKREMLADYYRQYQSFNIENLDKEIRDELAR